MINIILFLQFVKYGILCFGGGYMIIPLLYADFVQNEKIFTPEVYGNLLAISQMTPGAVSINTATYVGFLKANILGSIAATIGLCFPTFILTSLFLNVLHKYRDKALVVGFLRGAKWAALIMILYAISLFANISIFKEPLNLQLLFNNSVQATFGINILEFIIMFLCVVFARKMPFMVLLFLSAVIGGGLSYLW